MRLYNESPFPLLYESKSNSEALDRLLSECYDIGDERFSSGDFSDFIVCFNECPDALMQWQAYADNVIGCCLAFSLPLLRQYCEQTNGVPRIEKGQYLDWKEPDNLVAQKATIDNKPPPSQSGISENGQNVHRLLPASLVLWFQLLFHGQSQCHFFQQGMPVHRFLFACLQNWLQATQQSLSRRFYRH